MSLLYCYCVLLPSSGAAKVAHMHIHTLTNAQARAQTKTVYMKERAVTFSVFYCAGSGRVSVCIL